jgi:hypothetical protein
MKQSLGLFNARKLTATAIYAGRSSSKPISPKGTGGKQAQNNHRQTLNFSET